MNRRRLFTIFTIVLTDLIGFGIIIPLLPTVSESLGVSGLGLGLLIASYAVAQFIASPILGSLSDRFGRKPILVISKAGTVIAYIMLATAHSFPILILSRLIDGFTGGNIPAARAYISDITTKENRSQGMAVIGIGFGLGFIIGPALGGIFYSLGHSAFLPGMVGAGISLFSLILTQVFLDESHRDSQAIETRPFSLKNFMEIFQHPAIQKILLVQFVLMTVTAGYQTTLTFFTDKLFSFNPEQNSLLFVYLGFLGLFIQGFLVRKKIINLLQVTKIGLFINALGVILIAISPSWIYLFLFLAINSIGGSLVGVTLPSLLSTTDSTDPEGEIQGAFEGVGSLGRVIGPLLVGSLINISPRPIYFFSGIVLLLVPFLLPRPEPTR